MHVGVQRFTCSRSLKLKSVDEATAKLRMDQIYKLTSYEDSNYRLSSSRMRSKCFQPTRALVITPSCTVAYCLCRSTWEFETGRGRGSRFSIQTTPEPGRLDAECWGGMRKYLRQVHSSGTADYIFSPLQHLQLFSSCHIIQNL